MNTSIIEEHREGKQTDLFYTITLAGREEAQDCFKRAYKRLLNPPVWHELCGFLSARFSLVAADGHELRRLAEEGDFFRIDIPGPGSALGDGYDWVQVAAIDDGTDPDAEEESFAMKLRPCRNPLKHGANVAHFFRAEASSVFVIRRKGNNVVASYHGRNEVPNTDTNKTIDNIRNAIIASGAFASLSEAQWSMLCKEFLGPEIGG